MTEPTPTPTPDADKEPETLGELIDHIVGKAVPNAIENARKAWAKDLADLLDVGADNSTVDDPTNIPTPAPVGDPTPVGDPPAPTAVRNRKYSLL